MLNTRTSPRITVIEVLASVAASITKSAGSGVDMIMAYAVGEITMNDAGGVNCGSLLLKRTIPCSI